MTYDSRIKDIFYRRKNGENIVNDPESIKSCKNEQSRDIIDNARLGSYDKFGNYIIIPDIKRELISMPKLVYNVKNENGNTIYEMKGNIPIFGDVFFKLTFSKSEAILSLTEMVKREANGYLEVYDEAIDSCLCGDGGLPKDVIFRNFHVVEDPEAFQKMPTLYDFNNILTRKTYLTILSKELNSISKVDEQLAFDNMVKTLKSSGDYGKKVLTDFVERLKDRPGIFEIQKTEKYNKAINEVLLSSLEVSTTKEDKEDLSTRETYLKVLNARNENIDKYLEEANARVDEKYVETIVNKATETYNKGTEKSEEENDFIISLDEKKKNTSKRKLEKPVLKQGKGAEEEETKDGKEEKIRAIVKKEEKKKDKKTEKTKKLNPAKKAQKSSKLKSKKKPVKKLNKKPKRKLAKGKLKKKKKKLNKAKAPKFASKKVGGPLKKAPASAKKKVDNMLIGRLVVNKFYDKPQENKEPDDKEDIVFNNQTNSKVNFFNNKEDKDALNMKGLNDIFAIKENKSETKNNFQTKSEEKPVQDMKEEPNFNNQDLVKAIEQHAQTMHEEKTGVFDQPAFPGQNDIQQTSTSESQLDIPLENLDQNN